MPHAFDEDLYLALNPDVRRAIADGTFKSADEHWKALGRREETEGLRPTIGKHLRDLAAAGTSVWSPASAFNPITYLNAHPDLQAAFGHDLNAAHDHWLQHGRREGRTIGEGPAYRRRTCIARLLGRPLGVNFYAPLSSQSGLGAAARGYRAAFRAANLPLRLVNYEYFDGHFHIDPQDAEPAAPYRINVIQVNAIGIKQFMSEFGQTLFDDAYNIAIWAWELSTFRPDWQDRFENLDEIWALSDFNRDAIATVSPLPVTTIRPALTPRLDPADAPKVWNRPDGFVFVCVFDVGSQLERKNPQAVIAAFRASFAHREDVHLLLKFHSAHYNRAEVDDLLRAIAPDRNIHVVSDLLTPAALQNLLDSTDCLVSAHRAEGFGLNIAEYMRDGKPVIATSYSGNTDFTLEDCSFLVRYELVRTGQAPFPYETGSVWADPSVPHLSELMNYVADNPSAAQAVGSRAARHVQEILSPERIGRAIADRVAQLRFEADLPAFVRHLSGNSAAPAPARAATPDAEQDPTDAQHRVSIFVDLTSCRSAELARFVEDVLSIGSLACEICLIVSSRLDPDVIDTAMSYRGSDARIKVRPLGDAVDKVASLQSFAEIASGAWSLLVSNPAFSQDHDLERICTSIRARPGADIVIAPRISWSQTALLLLDRSRVRSLGRVVRDPGVPVGCCLVRSDVLLKLAFGQTYRTVRPLLLAGAFAEI
ncbi:hypothetical protein A3862_24700 [Methylobacterium sp. XJLW]|nr:hypothetical protein A3862_24700 [Methylobacterium sp. XJLW]